MSGQVLDQLLGGLQRNPYICPRRPAGIPPVGQTRLLSDQGVGVAWVDGLPFDRCSIAPSVSFLDISPGTAARERKTLPICLVPRHLRWDCGKGEEYLAFLPRLFGRGRCRACEAEGEDEPNSDPDTPRTAYQSSPIRQPTRVIRTLVSPRIGWEVVEGGFLDCFHVFTPDASRFLVSARTSIPGDRPNPPAAISSWARELTEFGGSRVVADRRGTMGGCLASGWATEPERET